MSFPKLLHRIFRSSSSNNITEAIAEGVIKTLAVRGKFFSRDIVLGTCNVVVASIRIFASLIALSNDGSSETIFVTKKRGILFLRFFGEYH